MDPRTTRRQLLGAGAGAGAAALLGAAPALGKSKRQARSAVTQLPPAQARAEAMRIERLLRVELLILFTYEHVLSSSILPADARSTLLPLRGHEQTHVQLLTARLTALGGAVPRPPANVDAADKDLAKRSVKGRLGQLKGERDALHLLLAVERVVVGAYFVSLLTLDDPRLITLVAQIMSADAQHEAVIGELLYPGQAQKAVPYGLVQGVQ